MLFVSVSVLSRFSRTSTRYGALQLFPWLTARGSVLAFDYENIVKVSLYGVDEGRGGSYPNTAVTR